ncbi:MAG: hypothetical protein E7676_01320 [Ruminococcaceae bacterium]|nr:hypothetical protein [Oscillospiraceae bacterium]
MSKRRVFNKNIIYRRDLTRLPDRARILYQYMILEADDDGFVDDPMRVVRMAEATEENYGMLIDAGFLFEFKTGVCVLMHWLCHNSTDREGYISTIFTEERSQLKIKPNGEYCLR